MKRTYETYELPCYDDRKSFYRKAIVIEEDNTTYLKSYDTIVAKIKNGVFSRLWDDYSLTTMRHINSFRYHFNMKKISKKEWMELEVE